MADPLYIEKYRWRAELPMAPAPTIDDRESGGELHPFHAPWIVGGSMYFKHHNRIYSYSLVNGRQRWAFDLPPLDRDIGRNVRMELPSHRLCTVWQAEQSILVDNEMVYANVGSYDRNQSLVALDRATGQLQWAAGRGNGASQDKSDLATEYSAAREALGRAAIFQDLVLSGRERGVIIPHTTSRSLTAFDKLTGAVLWRKDLARLVPTATTQERRGIRVYASPPVVNEGIVYCCTNAGVLVALDADTGFARRRWLIRYPHVRQREEPRACPSSTAMMFSRSVQTACRKSIRPDLSANRRVLKDGRLYAAPACRWRRGLLFRSGNRKSPLVYHASRPRHANRNAHGISRGVFHKTRELIVSGGEVGFYDLETGPKTWSFVPSGFCTWGHMAGIFTTTPFVDHPQFPHSGTANPD